MNSTKTVYYLYIVTNPNKTTLYTGVTNNLSARIIEHWENRGQFGTFAGRYFCYNLLYYECFQFIQDAIDKEKKVKKWDRAKKDALIQTKNPEMTFLNEKVCGQWPPKITDRRF